MAHGDQGATVTDDVEVLLQMFLSTAATNCSGERLFSALKRVKIVFRSTMGQNRLNSLALLNIESWFFPHWYWKSFQLFYELRLTRAIIPCWVNVSWLHDDWWLPLHWIFSFRPFGCFHRIIVFNCATWRSFKIAMLLNLLFQLWSIYFK